MGSPGIAAVLVLAGGFGRRLGTPKAWLAWEGAPLLLHVLKRLAPLAGRTIVAARPGQDLPAGTYDRADDRLPGAGPLAALAGGLKLAADPDPDARVAVSACDYPFADPNLFASLAAIAPGAELVLPRWRGRLHPLQAVWRAGLAATCEQELLTGMRRIRDVLAMIDCAVLDVEDLPGIVDPARSLLNLNDAADLARAHGLAT